MQLAEDVLSETTNPASTPQTTRLTWLQHIISTMDALWVGLRQPWLLVLSGLVILLLLTSAILLPQLPGELRDDPTVASRWLANISTQYGGWGALARTLGLFNILHSAVLLVVLAVISLILFIHLGDLLAALGNLRRLSHLLRSPVKSAGEPLPISAVQMLHRQRVTSTQSTAKTVELIQANLAARFGQPLTYTIPLAMNRDNANLRQKSANQMLHHETVDEEDGETETRILATRHKLGAILRPALMVGLLLALLVVWFIILLGWEVTAPVLAPGDEYHFASQQLQIQYTVSVQSNVIHPLLHIRLDQAEVSLPVATDRLNLAGVGFQVQTGPPGLYIAALDETSVLARAGQAETASTIGLIFPSPGSEESVVLPAQSVGLRIVRMADTASAIGPAFMVEVYNGERSQPTQRVEISAAQLETIQVNEQGFALRILPVPGAIVSARHLPHVWLLWLAFALVLIGAAGYWFRPAFVLVQVSPWVDERSVVVIQSDRHPELQQINQVVTTPMLAEG